jgi:ATP-dependent Clp protease ATP-binding subunit ClpA
MGNPWIIRVMIFSLFLTLAKMAPGLAWVIVLVCCVYAALAVLAHLGRLPEPIAKLFVPKAGPINSKDAPKINPQSCETPESMERYFSEHVIGQPVACREVSKMLYRRIHAPRKNKPLGVFCFAGPPGVGKTLFAKVANQLLFDGNPLTLLHVDMSQYSQPHTVSNLFGQPRGYAGSDQYGQITAKLRDFPNSIILLDEFEKAHPDVHKRFLTAWNDGFISEGSDNSQVSTTGAIFLITTNAASLQVGEIAERYAKEPEERLNASRNALQESGFAPEVLSRIDYIFAFSSLKDLDVARVASLEILSLVEENELEVMHGGIDPSILLGSVIRYEKLGNSVTVRDIVRAIENDLSDGIIEARRAGAKTIALREEGDKVFVDIIDYVETVQSHDTTQIASYN